MGPGCRICLITRGKRRRSEPERNPGSGRPTRPVRREPPLDGDPQAVHSPGEVSGPATAEVALRFEREDGVYQLSVDFFGPPLPIRIEHFRNGVSESVQIVDYQECSFRHDVTRSLPSPLDVLIGKDTGDDPPRRHEMEWRLERAR